MLETHNDSLLQAKYSILYKNQFHILLKYFYGNKFKLLLSFCPIHHMYV